VQEALFAILLKYDGRYGIRLIKDRENRIDINAIKWSFKRSLGVDCYNFEWQLKNAIGNSLPQVIKSVSDDNKRRVEAELKAGIDFNPPNIQGKSDLQELPQLFDNYLLSSRYISLIDNTFLELAIGDFHPHEPSNLSVEKISDYMTRLFKTGFIEYQQLVECNFPGIKENLYWYKRLPIETILDLGTTDNESGCVNLRIGYIFNSRQGFKVSISPQTESQIFSFDNGLSANLNGSHVDIDHLTGSTVESFMFSYGSIGVNSGSRWSRNKMPIRSFVYELLLEDFRELEESPINEMLS
jgi:hypothetical protein